MGDHQDHLTHDQLRLEERLKKLKLARQSFIHAVCTYDVYHQLLTLLAGTGFPLLPSAHVPGNVISSRSDFSSRSEIISIFDSFSYTVTLTTAHVSNLQRSNAVRFASTRNNNFSDQRPPLVGQRPIQPPHGPLRMGGTPYIPRANILDLTCQPCEFPPPTTSTPYRKPMAVNFATRKTSVTHRDANGPAEKQAAPQNVYQTKERMLRAESDKTSKELMAKLQISARSLKKANDSLANCFKSTTPGRNPNTNK